MLRAVSHELRIIANRETTTETGLVSLREVILWINALFTNVN